MEVTMIAAIFCVVCLIIGYLLYYLGAFKKVVISAGSPPIGEAVIAYKFGKGPYMKVAGRIFKEIDGLTKFPSAKCLGIYYDNPNEIPQEKNRSACAVVLSEGGAKVDKQLEEKMTSHGYKVIHLPAVTNCVKTAFPFVSFISDVIALSMAMWKVYPKLGAYIAERKLSAFPMLEIYTEDTINFMAPLEKHDDFFVPEALECIPEEYKTMERKK